MRIPDWATAIIEDFEKRTEPFMEVQIHDALAQRSKKEEKIADEDFEGFRAEASAFFFYERRSGDSIWGTYFAPTFSATSTEGKKIVVPDITQLTADVVTHWEKRARECSNPVMTARYADVVWDLANAITGKKPRPEFARIAIDAYMEATDRNFFTPEVAGIQWLERALDLAQSINDPERTKRVVNFMFEFYGRIARPSLIGTWLFLFDNLYGTKLINPEQENKIIEQLEEMLAKTSKHDNKTLDPWGAQAAGERLARHFERQKDRGNVQRVTKAYGSAFGQLASEANATLATAWLQPVVEKYQQVGLKEEAEKLRLVSAEKAKNIKAEMKEVTVKLEIPDKELEEFLEKITSPDLQAALRQIAIQFIPDVHNAKKFLQKIRTDAPFQALIGTVKFDDGHIVAKAGSIDEDPEGRLHLQLAQNIQISQIFLVSALSKVKDKYAPKVDEILTFLYSSPVFLESQRELLTEGLTAFQSADYVKAIHVLIPQIEQCTRSVLALLGIPTDKPVARQPGINDVKNMNDALSDERVQAALTENLWRYFYVLFVDRRGLNLRNRVAHGSVTARELRYPIAAQVLHSLLALGLLREQKTDKTEK